MSMTKNLFWTILLSFPVPIIIYQIVKQVCDLYKKIKLYAENRNFHYYFFSVRKIVSHFLSRSFNVFCCCYFLPSFHYFLSINCCYCVTLFLVLLCIKTKQKWFRLLFWIILLVEFMCQIFFLVNIYYHLKICVWSATRAKLFTVILSNDCIG